jgi:hypothetical protein
MVHEAYQNGGEYQPLPFDQWLIKQMLQSPPVGAWIKSDGTVSYGFMSQRPINDSEGVKWFKINDPNNIQEVQEKWRKNLQDPIFSSRVFTTKINDRQITASRLFLPNMGDLKAINLGYMEMPGYPNTLILIAGAFDENGNWYLQPFVVNHAPISVGEGKTAYPTKFNYPGLFLTLDDYRNRLSEVSLDQPNELFQLIGNQLTLEGASSVVIMDGKTLDEATMSNVELAAILYRINGLELVGAIFDLGPAPEYPHLQPVP